MEALNHNAREVGALYAGAVESPPAGDGEEAGRGWS